MRLRELRVHEGVTCSLELAFDYHSRLYVYEMQPDWYDEFLGVEDEIMSLMADHEDMDDDEPLGGYYLQELPTGMPASRWLIPTPDPPAAQALADALGIASPAAKVLVHRGLADPACARRFLVPRSTTCSTLSCCATCSRPSSASAGRFRRARRS